MAVRVENRVVRPDTRKKQRGNGNRYDLASCLRFFNHLPPIKVITYHVTDNHKDKLLLEINAKFAVVAVQEEKKRVLLFL